MLYALYWVSPVLALWYQSVTLISIAQLARLTIKLVSTLDRANEKKWWKQIKADLKYQIIISQCSGSNPHMSICKLETPKSRSWLYIHIHHSTLASRVSSVRLGQFASPSVSHARPQLLRSQRIGLDWIGSDRNGSPWIGVENAQLVAHTSILMQPGHGWRLINIATR